MRNLIYFIKVLGFKNGIRYWKLDRKIRKNKQVGVRLIEDLKKKSAALRLTGEIELALINEHFTLSFERSMAEWERKNPNWK